MSTTALPGELREDENFTTALYRAAIGPVSTDYYLSLFTEWEGAGRWRPRWNTAAGLWTLGWLIFRKMGGIALAYVGALVGSLLLIFGIGSLLLSLSQSAQWVAFGVWLALAVLVPGLWGNRWFHQHCRKRMDTALAAQTDVAQACADLATQSSPRKRALMVAGVQAGLLLAVSLAALQFSALLQRPGVPSVKATPSPQTAKGSVKEWGDVLPVNAAPASAPSAFASASVAPASAASASAPLATSAATAASQPASSASPPSSAPAAPLLAPATAATSVATQVAPVAAKAKKAAPAPAAPPAKKPVRQPVVATQSTPVKAPPSASEKIGTTPRYGVNVGLFAKAENAQSVRSKLEGASLPVLSETLNMPHGPRIRLRVGPFATQAQAAAAVTQVRALGLDALPYRE